MSTRGNYLGLHARASFVLAETNEECGTWIVPELGVTLLLFPVSAEKMFEIIS